MVGLFFFPHSLPFLILYCFSDRSILNFISDSLFWYHKQRIGKRDFCNLKPSLEVWMFKKVASQQVWDSAQWAHSLLWSALMLALLPWGKAHWWTFLSSNTQIRKFYSAVKKKRRRKPVIKIAIWNTAIPKRCYRTKRLFASVLWCFTVATNVESICS